MAGKDIVAKYCHLLSEFEKIEVLEYDSVYFIGHKSKKFSGENKFDNEK